MSRSMPVLSALLVALGTAGCISVQSGNAKVFQTYPPAAMTPGRTATLTTIAAIVTQRAMGQVVKADAQSSTPSGLVAGLQKAFDETGYFSFNPEKIGNEEYELTVSVDNEGNPRLWLAVICGLTLTVLPAVATDTYKIVATLKDRSGRVLGTRRLDHKITTVIEFFMLFGMPFASPIHASRELMEVVARDLAVWTHELVAPLATPPAAPLPTALGPAVAPGPRAGP